MGDRDRYRAPPQPEPPPHRVRAADLYPRLRTQYDEPGLDAGFTPICGEFVQWVGRTVDGGTIAMSNYRLHVQPRRRNGVGASIPLRLIDTVEPREVLHLVVLCKNGRHLKCTFNTADQCTEWSRRLNTALAPMGSVQETFAAAYAAWAKEQPPMSVYRTLMKASQPPQTHWFGPEVERLGFLEKGAWRVTAANAEYKLCPSYPPLIIVPATFNDEDLDSVARFRSMRRVPAVVWRHRSNGAVIARSSQPEVGWLGWRSSEDERLLAAYVTACHADRGEMSPKRQLKLLIVDARSYASAVTNRARGGGVECQQYYPAADIQFMCLSNIHNVRKSFLAMRSLAADPNEQTNWHSILERTLWLQYVSGLLRTACVVAHAVVAGRPVLVHCSDGWDRTPQIVATAQLILDPHYRTLEGFRILIEREWLDFGHKFADRCGHPFGPEDTSERSPIFLQWLDVVRQMTLQFPCSFEFNEAYLIKLATHIHSCMFGTFLCNTSRERNESGISDVTPQVWHLLQSPAYRNHLYAPYELEQQAIWPEYSVRTMCVWNAMFCAQSAPDESRFEHMPDPPAQPLHSTPTQSGLKTKTRSCDNLLSEGEKRTTQRRCSDPNLAPDVTKLSMVVNSECENRRECRAALSDSCVDELPIFPPASDSSDSVDGLHPDHFENSTLLLRDLASGSSSLERELGGELTDKIIPDQVIDSDDLTASDNSQLNDTVADNVPNVVTSVTYPDVDTPEEPPVFVSDSYVIGMAETTRESARTRNISITWRSISESSNQSFTGFEINEGRAEPPSRNTSHDSSPLDNHTAEDRTNHNVVNDINHTRENSVTTNGTTNGLDDVPSKFHEVDLNGGVTSSSISSESEGEAHTQPRRTAHAHTRTRVASQLTLCPTSPRRLACCHCSRRASATNGVETSGESGGSSEVCWCGGVRLRCVCGAAAPAPRADPLDGLPPALDPLQARLHQIILHQQKIVDDLNDKLRVAHEALRVTSPAPAPPAAPPAAPPPQKTSSGSGSVRGSGSSSGSASEVEVGEEARSVVWLPDSAAPRCQYCRNQFWLARRRHHCRRCGGIFCGSCSEMSSWGDCGTMRLCRRCRTMR